MIGKCLLMLFQCQHQIKKTAKITYIYVHNGNKILHIEQILTTTTSKPILLSNSLNFGSTVYSPFPNFHSPSPKFNPITLHNKPFSLWFFLFSFLALFLFSFFSLLFSFFSLLFSLLFPLLFSHLFPLLFLLSFLRFLSPIQINAQETIKNLNFYKS